MVGYVVLVESGLGARLIVDRHGNVQSEVSWSKCDAIEQQRLSSPSEGVAFESALQFLAKRGLVDRDLPSCWEQRSIRVGDRLLVHGCYWSEQIIQLKLVRVDISQKNG